MSKVGVSLKIDVTNIERERLYVGKKGKYLDATVFIDLDELDQYGNSGMITQDVTKEEREQKVQGPILGNAKVFWRDDFSSPNKAEDKGSEPKYHKDQSDEPFEDDIPFN